MIRYSITIVAGLALVAGAYAQTNQMPNEMSRLGFYEQNLGLVKKFLSSNCFDPTSAAACMVKNPTACVSLMDEGLDTCWSSLRDAAPKVAGPDALSFNTRIAQCVIPEFRRLVAQSDDRVENYRVPCREQMPVPPSSTLRRDALPDARP